MDSEQFKTPKTDCVLKVSQDKEVYMDSRFVDLESIGFSATLSAEFVQSQFKPCVILCMFVTVRLLKTITESHSVRRIAWT